MSTSPGCVVVWLDVGFLRGLFMVVIDFDL